MEVTPIGGNGDIHIVTRVGKRNGIPPRIRVSGRKKRGIRGHREKEGFGRRLSLGIRKLPKVIIDRTQWRRKLPLAIIDRTQWRRKLPLAIIDRTQWRRKLPLAIIVRGLSELRTPDRGLRRPWPSLKRIRGAPCGMPLIFLSGKRGIRTPGTFQYFGFQDRRNRPLCHLSFAFGEKACKSTAFFSIVQTFAKFFLCFCSSDPAGAQTQNLQNRNLTLYSIELRDPLALALA